MKVLAFKIKNYWRIWRANLVNTFQGETAYFGNNWGNLISTVFYTAVQILFINVLYSRVPSFAGYSKNDMYFVMFVGQAGFYFLWGWSEMNNRLLIEDIKKGALDFLLVLPVPSLWYVTFRKIPLLTIARDGFPNLILIAALINWSQLSFTWFSLVMGVIIFILGQIAWSGFNFLLVLPVFWEGESKQIYSLSYALRDTDNVPWEGYRPVFQFSLSILIPTLILSAIPVSVILGKSNAWQMLTLAFCVALFFSLLKIRLWKFALKNYTSAS